MNRFITGRELVETVDNIIWHAEQTLLIVSPFIKLDDHFKKLFDKLEHKHELHIIIVFGKNESEVNRSFNQADFEYFKKFPKISIIYVPNLHAKYYGNEKKGVITSINLYDASFKNNIEFGIYSEQSILNNITDHFSHNTDKEAWDECFKIASGNDVVFIKRPVYEDKKFIITLGKNYLRSDVQLDYTEHFYLRKSKNYEPKRLDDFEEQLNIESLKPVRQLAEPEVNKGFGGNKFVAEERVSYESAIERKRGFDTGFCIRTGEPIPFNPTRPFSYNAWRSWSQFENYEYSEKYCHRTGKPSYGKTSMRNPVLYND